jgi:NodT family efflux transporter outer membrane factor (OMF) lipoprotein
LNASVEDYDDVLVTLLADVGTNYVQLRTLEKRLELARTSVQLFDEMLRIAKARYTAEAKNRVPYDMAKANLAQAQALIPKLEISRRQTENQLCILLGMPPRGLREELGAAAIPAPPVEVAVGIPADLLRRRPDVRRTERQAAAQSAQIGVAASDFYPQISIEGTLGVSSKEVRNLFKGDSLRGEIGPGFQWNILNYGRIRNNVLYQDARFQELVTQYQQTVLKAGGEADSAIVAFLQSQERAKALATSAASWRDGTEILVAQYRAGLIDFFEVAYFEQNLIEQQDEAAQAQGDISLALVEIYRALGGGWQIRLEAEPRVAGPNAAGSSDPNAPAPTPKKDKEPPAEVIPAPKP